jgi:AraC-like DNA-binding protein
VENAAGCLRVVGDSNEVIGPYDLVLITSPELEHAWEQNGRPATDIHEITIQFRLDFDRENSAFLTNPFDSIYKMLVRARKGLSFPMSSIMRVYRQLTNLSSIKEGFLAVLALLDILYELSKGEATELSSSAFAQVPVTSDSRRVLKVKNYIDAHYMEPLRLTQLCDIAGMTPSAFSRFFKLRTGKTLNEYIIDVRLGYATRMLVDTTSTIAEISYCCGFNTLSNFNRQFKKGKGCSPSEFRKKYRKTKVII